MSQEFQLAHMPEALIAFCEGKTHDFHDETDEGAFFTIQRMDGPMMGGVIIGCHFYDGNEDTIITISINSLSDTLRHNLVGSLWTDYCEGKDQ